MVNSLNWKFFKSQNYYYFIMYKYPGFTRKIKLFLLIKCTKIDIRISLSMLDTGGRTVKKIPREFRLFSDEGGSGSGSGDGETHILLHLFSFLSAKFYLTTECGKNKKVAHETMMFLPCCDALYASITEQTTGKWNLFVLYNKYMKKYILKDLLNFPEEFLGH